MPGSPESEDPPLAEEGHRQAQALARRLEGKHIDVIASSDLRRAADTARYLADGRGLEVVQRADLREVFLGEWERGEFRRRAAAADPEWLRFAEAGRWDLVPGSEGDDAFRARVTAAVNGLATQHEGGSIAIAAHGGVINAYLAATFGIERSFFTTIENTSLTILRVSGERRLLVTVNDCSHLYDPAVMSTSGDSGTPAG